MEGDTGWSSGLWHASEHVLRKSRFVMAVPVALLLLAALGAFVYGLVVFVDATRQIVDHPFPIHKNIGLFVVLVDLFLVGATLLIAGVGLYELFVSPEGDSEYRHLFPSWLVMRDLNDLKARVLSMIVLVTAVSFTDSVVDFPNGKDVFYLGAGVAMFVVALTIFLRFGTKGHDEQQ